MAKNKDFEAINRMNAFELHEFIVNGIRGLGASVLPQYEDFTEKVLSETITDLKVIERQLDNIIGYAFDEKILVLYKKILKKIYPRAPEVVEFHIDEYYNYHKDDGEVDVELEGTSVKITPIDKKKRYKEFLA